LSRKTKAPYTRNTRTFAASGAGSSIELEALLTGGKETKLSSSASAGVKISATVVEHGRDQKIVVFKKKRRKAVQANAWPPPGFTSVKIDSIG